MRTRHSRPALLPAAVAAGMSPLAQAPAIAQVVTEHARLTAVTDASGGGYGFSLAATDDLIAIGAFFDHENGEDAGAAYIVDAHTRGQVVKLLASDGAEFDMLGYAIAMDPSVGLVAVGAPYDDDLGTDSGSVYLFDLRTGVQVAKLVPEDGARKDWFGFSLAMDEGLLAVGAWGDDDMGGKAGAVYLYDARTLTLRRKLYAADPNQIDRFGFSVALSGGLLAVGAFGDDDQAEDAGAAYVFDASTGEQLHKCVAVDGAQGDELGFSVAISDTMVAVGAWKNDTNGESSGAVYTFDVGTGEQLAKLVPTDGAQGDLFGYAVALSGEVVVGGARLSRNGGIDTGAAYRCDGRTGEQLAKLLARTRSENSSYGCAVAICGPSAVIGAYSDGPYGKWYFGSVHLVDFECLADFDRDGDRDAEDVAEFLSVWGRKGAYADWHVDGEIDTRDLIGFVNDWAAGC